MLIDTCDPKQIQRHHPSTLESLERKIDHAYGSTKEQIIQFLYSAENTLDSKSLQRLYRQVNTKQIDLSVLHRVVPKIKPDMKFLAKETQAVQNALDSAHLKPESVRSIPRFNLNTVIKDIAKENMGFLKREIVQRVDEEKAMLNRATLLKKSQTTVRQNNKTHKKDISSELLIQEYSIFSPAHDVSPEEVKLDEMSKKSSFISSQQMQSMKHASEVASKHEHEAIAIEIPQVHKKTKSIGFAIPTSPQEAQDAWKTHLSQAGSISDPPTQFVPAEEVLEKLRHMYVEASEPTTATKEYAIHDLICRVDRNP